MPTPNRSFTSFTVSVTSRSAFAAVPSLSNFGGAKCYREQYVPCGRCQCLDQFLYYAVLPTTPEYSV